MIDNVADIGVIVKLSLMLVPGWRYSEKYLGSSATPLLISQNNNEELCHNARQHTEL